MDAARSDTDAVRALVVEYCEAIHHARPEVFVEMCHEKFLMTAADGAGGVQFWDKPLYIERVSSRAPFPGEASYEIHSVDVAGGEIARAHLWVDVPPRRFEDHLGFVKVDGTWKLMTKVFRTQDGPAL